MFADQIALITGATGFGIGTTTAEFLARKGATVILNGTNEVRLAQAANYISNLGGIVDTALGDVSDIETVNLMIEKIMHKHRKIDILINNAAHGAVNQPISSFSNSDWDSDLAEILSASFYCTKFVAQNMIARRFGKIVYVSSTAAIRGTWRRGVSYAASKAGLIGMTKCLALELAEYGINVNAVAPSQVATPRIFKTGKWTEESLQEYGKKFIPLGRVGNPEDVANLIVFLVSDESSYITGQVIEIDGGSSLDFKRW